MTNSFFTNQGPFKIENLLNLSGIDNTKNFINDNIIDIKDLVTAEINNITFFHSKKYESLALKTKATYCITTKNLSHILPSSCKPLVVDNVLIATAKITKVLYPNSITDDFDPTVKFIEKTAFKKIVTYLMSLILGFLFFAAFVAYMKNYL